MILSTATVLVLHARMRYVRDRECRASKRVGKVLRVATASTFVIPFCLLVYYPKSSFQILKSVILRYLRPLCTTYGSDLKRNSCAVCFFISNFTLLILVLSGSLIFSIVFFNMLLKYVL